MPRRRTLTGRTERGRDRDAQYSRRRRNVNMNDNIVNNDDNLFVNLVSGFKCAWNEIPYNFNSFHCGLLNLTCTHCRAKHFNGEITRGSRNSFTLCCHKGKVFLTPYTHNSFFKNFYDGLVSTNNGIKRKSKNYFENIRSYNSAFAMISSEAQVNEEVMQGVYHFKIHDVFYHRAGPMSPAYGYNPCYAQLYFYDVDTANAHRMRTVSNQNCDPHIMHEISHELNRSNIYVRSFYSMKQFCDEHNGREVSMLIHVDPSTMDLRRFNDATTTDVAVIFTTTDGDPPFDRNMVAFQRNGGALKHVSVLDPSLDPLAYPLLFPNGDKGWQPNVTHNLPSTSRSLAPRNKITMLQYACFRLAIRDEFSLLHHSQKLFLQWIVDMYIRIEGTRLHFIKTNQANLRTELYNNLTDYVHGQGNDDAPGNVGRHIILPSSFTGSPRNMYQNYLDAMCIVQHFGKPSLFVTMTCNPKWPDIVEYIGHESANYRPDIIVRVFKIKLKELIDDIVKKGIFGRVVSIIYTIEFQKRGLPHAHILITLHDDDKICGPVEIDKVVSAEIPSIQTQPKLHAYVKSHMMHGPCGTLNPNAVCMVQGKCSKDFPKNFSDFTREAVNGYPIYRRRDNGISIDVRGKSLDNRFVVPHNAYLLAKYNCHINVEVCTTVKSVKYIYKYVYKGYDSATVEVGSIQDRQDEVKNYVNGRYVGSTESMWRIYEFPMHFQSHTIMRLDIHLPNRQNIIFREGHEQQAIQNVRNTKLLAYFQLNNEDRYARQIKYVDIPTHYTWNNAEKRWQRRVLGGDKILTRMYVVSPRDVELFHLRLLLLHVVGAKSFADVRTYNGVIYNSFIEACHARGIASNDNEWRVCLNECKEFHSPRQMRELFAFICALNVPANALLLWEEFKEDLSEDFLINHSEDVSFNRSLIEIEEILIVHNVNCEALGLPIPNYSNNIQDDIENIDPQEEELLFGELYAQANAQQKNIIDQVIKEVVHHDTGSNVFILTAHAGCGKTFTQRVVIHKINSLNRYCIATAYSGIASTLLINGRTLHNVFKLPIPLLDTSVANITPNSKQGRYINNASLIIIDEVSMCPVQLLKILDKLLKDLCTVEENKTKLFGGKTMLLCGDFRQILPVVPRASRAILIENYIKSWSEYHSFHKISLSENMRVSPNQIEFVEYLKKIGNGTAVTFPQFGEDIIEIPQHLIGNVENIINDVYGNLGQNLLTDQIMNSVVLACTNEDCAAVNNDVLNRMPGEFKVYTSFDKVVSEDEAEINNFPIEFLNTLDVSGFPPHRLKMKLNCIVLLIRNLNTSQGLVNGTRMRVKALHNNSVDCEVLTGHSRNKRFLIPRTHMQSSGSELPFKFQRTQFPLIVAFAMTINKSQGQTFQKVGILLKRPVFTHGQLYVASSRVTTFEGLKYYIEEHTGQGHLANDDRIFTKNIVFREVLL